MRLKVRFPQVEPNTYEMPATCPYGCGGQAYRRHGIKGERKPLRDVKYAEVLSYRYTCVRCGQKVILIPDHTRSLPLPELFRMVVEILHDVSQLTVMVALGTHPGYSEEEGLTVWSASRLMSVLPSTGTFA